MRFGERLRRRRRDDLAITAGEAAAQIGVSQPSFSKWENGNAKPDSRYFAALAKFLDASEAEVVQWIYATEEEGALAERVSQLETQMARVLSRLEQLADRWPDAPPGDQAQP